MRMLNRIRFALNSLRNRDRFEADMNAEIADFLERDTEHRMRQGLSKDAAVRAARVEMHGVEQTRERVRELRPGVWFELFWQDVRFAARTFRRRPAYLFLALLTIALGIGANTAIFSLIHAVLMQPLPYRDADRLVLLQTQTRDSLVPQVAYLDFTDVRDQHPGIENATIFLYDAVVLERQSGERQPVRKYGLRVDSSFFETLGVNPSLGRGFAKKEMIAGNDRVVVISDRLWKQEFGKQNNILGRQILINEQPRAIIGVMPEKFEIFLPMMETFTIQDIDIYVPLPDPRDYALYRSVFMMEAIARLRTGVTQKQAESDLAYISNQLAEMYPETNGNRALVMTPLKDQMTGSVRSALHLLMAAVVAVLLVACANLANLLIGRITARDQELAVRVALGASRLRLIRQLLAESVLMVGIGGIAGIALAWAVLPQITQHLASRVPNAPGIHLNAPVLLFAIGVCLITGIASGLLPARVLWRNRNAGLHGAARGFSGDRARMRKGLVVTEIALSCVLLAGAILLGSSFLSLMRVPIGFDSGKLLTFQIRLSESRYETRKQIAQTFRAFTERMGALSGVERSTVTSSLPLSGHNSGTAVWIEGRMPASGGQPPESRWQFVQPGYFETMRVPLLSGRLFQANDLEQQTHFTVISESVARRDFPNENPIGKRVAYGPPGQETDWHEIIGVVGDVRHGTLREKPVPRVYDLLGQHADLNLFVVVRTDQKASQIMPSIRAIASQLDPGAPLYDVRTMDQWKANSVDREQMLAEIVTLFAVAALFLGAVGAYGVISSLVTQRTREIGIRMALGAEPRSVLRSTIGEGLRLAAAGLAIGLIVSFSLAPMLRGILFGIDSTDPRAFVIVIASLLLVALAACYIPARRAAHVDPILALRQE